MWCDIYLQGGFVYSRRANLPYRQQACDFIDTSNIPKSKQGCRRQIRWHMTQRWQPVTQQAIIIEESLPPVSNSGSLRAELSTKVYRSVSKRKACLTTKYFSEKGYLGEKKCSYFLYNLDFWDTLANSNLPINHNRIRYQKVLKGVSWLTENLPATTMTVK